ncbi:MAG TPA: SDR family oxidoreductase [Pyrinomonadaceae bacterium]|nr:SDR family oxidoreductase [Acidobacteriota bacterium]HQZ94827.1 SDR family oxidoreductase [Pyrinomonadaceae bacterium]
MLYRESIFITGFPGFIAGRLLELLIKPETQFFVLVQPHFVHKAISELEAIAEIHQIPLESFVIVEGDITLPNLGITNDDLQTIQYETTDVFHLAAAYDLGVSKDVAFKVNLEGTRHVNDLVCSVKNLRRYNYVSTCYVAGNRNGVILETDLEHKAGFRNFYEETKYLAEIEVDKLKSHLPVTIFRPSVVVGDSMTGETVKYDGIYYLINYLRKMPSILRLVNIGNPSVRLNLVPVDFVVESIAALSRDLKTIGKTVAIADPAPLTTTEIFDVIAKDLSGRRSEFQLPMRIAEWFLHTGISPAVTGLPHNAVPYFFLSQTYDTGLSSELLSSHGITCPGFASYVGNLIDFVEENPKL